jgi:hypothetical protein
MYFRPRSLNIARDTRDKAGLVMYAHVTFGQIDPDQLDKYLDTIRTSSVPAVKEQPGYQGALFLADPHNGKFIAIAFFQTEADRQAIEDSGFADAQRSRTGSLLNLSREVPEFYQVRIADGNIRAVEGSASS